MPMMACGNRSAYEMYIITPAAKDSMWPRLRLVGTPMTMTISPPKIAATPLMVVNTIAVHGCFSLSFSLSLAVATVPEPECEHVEWSCPAGLEAAPLFP